MLVKNLLWREMMFPMQLTQPMERLHDTGRIQLCGINKDGLRVVLVCFEFGRFLRDISEAEAAKAYIYYVEKWLVWDGSEPFHAIGVATGGPPPGSFARAVVKVLEANYPETARRLIIYPIPWFLKAVLSAALWFMPPGIREKVIIESDESGFLDGAGLAPAMLPEILYGGREGMFRRMKPDQAKINELLKSLMAKGGEEPVLEELGMGVGALAEYERRTLEVERVVESGAPRVRGNGGLLGAFLCCMSRQSDPDDFMHEIATWPPPHNKAAAKCWSWRPAVLVVVVAAILTLIGPVLSALA